MKRKPWKTYLFWILLSEAVGTAAELLTREGVQIFNDTVQKPALNPPPIVFPIVWALLYLLMGVGAARIALSPDRLRKTGSLALFAAQLFFNFFWSILFFNTQAYGAAFLWLAVLWVLILWMTLSFSELDVPAALLQLPYLAWVFFAGYLNYAVWLLNR